MREGGREGGGGRKAGGEGEQGAGETEHGCPYPWTNLALDRIVGVHLLGLLGARLKQLQVPHVDGEEAGDGDPGQDAHDRGQYQHETHHHTLVVGRAGTAASRD